MDRGLGKVSTELGKKGKVLVLWIVLVKRRYWRLDWSENNHFLVSCCLLPLSSVSECTRRDLRGQEGKRGVGWWFGWACFVIVGTRGGGVSISF